MMDLWKERRYVDLWSLVHFLSGVVFAGWTFQFGFDGSIAFGAYLFLHILWEAIEAAVGIGEYLSNRVMDILFGLLGFIWIAAALDENGAIHFNALLGISAAFIILNVIGYLAYKRRKL